MKVQLKELLASNLEQKFIEYTDKIHDLAVPLRPSSDPLTGKNGFSTTMCNNEDCPFFMKRLGNPQLKLKDEKEMIEAKMLYENQMAEWISCADVPKPPMPKLQKYDKTQFVICHKLMRHLGL